MFLDFLESKAWLNCYRRVSYQAATSLSSSGCWGWLSRWSKMRLQVSSPPTTMASMDPYAEPPPPSAPMTRTKFQALHRIYWYLFMWWGILVLIATHFRNGEAKLAYKTPGPVKMDALFQLPLWLDIRMDKR